MNFEELKEEIYAQIDDYLEDYGVYILPYSELDEMIGIKDTVRTHQNIVKEFLKDFNVKIVDMTEVPFTSEDGTIRVTDSDFGLSYELSKK